MKFLGDSGKVYYFPKGKIVHGISSHLDLKKNTHFCLLDYDYTDSLELMAELSNLQQLFKEHFYRNLSNFYILKSSKGKKHAVCFTPLSWEEYCWILCTANIDPNHRYYSITNGYGVLRFTKKKDKKTSTIKLEMTVKGRGVEDYKTKQEYFQILGLEAI